MMVVQEDSNSSNEVEKAIDKKKYIVVKNHVREILVANPKEYMNDCENKTTVNAGNEKLNAKNVSSNERDSNSIDENDLEELRTLYSKCKNVIKRIETKYGHLLHLNEKSSNNRKRKYSSDCDCKCVLTKKIVYDDDGNQVHLDAAADHHICPSNYKKHKEIPSQKQIINMSIEHESISDLPDNIQDLHDVLKDPTLSKNLRYQVIQKVKEIRNMNLNTLRYDRPLLIKKLKSNPNEMLELFEFKGSNLSSLPGYPFD